GAGVGVGGDLGNRHFVTSPARAEDLRLGRKLAVDLKPDHRLELRMHQAPPFRDASNAAATDRSFSSPNAGAIRCSPTESPFSSSPQGSDRAGSPARFTGIVKMSLRYI